MRSSLIFILLIYFIWLKGLSTESAKIPTQRRFPVDASPIKAKIQKQKLSNIQSRRSTTTTAPVHNPGEFLNHFKIDDANDEYYGYDVPGENPFFPEYDHNGEDHEQEWIHPPNSQHMEEFPEYDYDVEPDDSDMEEEYDFSDRKRADKQDVESNERKRMAVLERKEKEPVKKFLKRWRSKNKNKSKGKPGYKKQTFSKNGDIAGAQTMKKNQIPKNSFWSGGFRKPFHKKKLKQKYGTTNWNPKKGKYISHDEKNTFKEPNKSSKFKGYKSKDSDDDYNRLVKKSINNSNPEGITYFPAETMGPKIPELPTNRGMTMKRSNEVRRQAVEEDQDLTEEPPNDLKPGAFKAQMFHERVVRNGSSGNELNSNDRLPLEKRQAVEEDQKLTVEPPNDLKPGAFKAQMCHERVVRNGSSGNELNSNYRLPLEKRRVIANNPPRRRRKHIENKETVKQYFPMNKRRLVKKDVNNSIPQYIPTTTTSTIYETTISDAPTTIFETEPPITGEIEPPTTMMIKKRTDNKRFVGPRYASQTRDVKEPISKVTNQEFENFYEQKGMHLVKLIYRIKEQELESIFDALNSSASSETGASLTTPALGDVVKLQSSVIQQLAKAIDEKQNRKTDHFRDLPPHKKDRNTHNVTKHRKNIAPNNVSDSKAFGGVEKRFKVPGMQSFGTSNLSGIDLQTALQLLYKIYKSKNNHGSSSVTKTAPTASSKPVTEILIRNLLKNPVFLQQLLSKNPNSGEETAGYLTPSMLQLLATSVLKTADKVEKNEVLDNGTKEKAVFKENQNLDGKLSKVFGDKSKAVATVNPEKVTQFGKDLPTTEGSTPEEDDKKMNAEKMKHILLQLLKNPSVVQRSNINKRKVRDSILKSNQIIARLRRLATAGTTRNTTSAVALEVSKDSEDSSATDQYSDITDGTTEDTDEEDEDESTTNSYVLTKSSQSSTPEVEDDTEDGDGDSGTEEREDPDESEISAENDTTLPTEHS